MEQISEVQSLNPKQVAQLMGCSEYTIRKLVREKNIPHFRIGRNIMFRERSLVKWIEKQEKRNYLQ